MINTCRTVQYLQARLTARAEQLWRWFACALQAAWACGRRRRVPVRLQLTAVECGAACLAMILSYHGRQTRVVECREWLGIGRDGVTAETLARAARAQGLRVKAYTVAELADMRYVPLPAIAHWEFEHFVVIERWSPKSVEIIDPAHGRRQLTAEQFAAGFTGVVLTCEPGVHFARRHTATLVPWYTSMVQPLWQTPGVLAQILAASLLLQGIGLVLPMVTMVLVDHILPLHRTSVMPALGLGMLLLVLAQVTVSYLRATLLIYLQARLDARLMLGFFDHMLALPWRFFEQRSSGDLLMRLSSNAMIRDTLTNQMLSLLLDGAFVLGYLALLLLREPLFGSAVLLFGALQVGLLLGTTRRVHDVTQRDLCAQAESQSYLVEALTGMLTLKASGCEDRAFDHWSNLFFQQLNVSLQRSHLAAVIDTAMLALRTFSPIALLWLGALRVLDGTLSLGMMLACNAIAAAFLLPLASLVANGQRLQLVGAHLERLRDVLEAAPEQEVSQVRTAPRLRGRIELRQVSFRYAPAAPLVLRDISLRIEPGQKIALVGRSGSGKSTLAKLLLGLYLPTEGEVLYDSIPLQTLNWRTLRSQFGVVLQEPVLFSGSIRQNIAMHHPSLTLTQVQEVAQIAAIHEEIMALPMGYDTRIAEGGSGLSGGQRQRLALARALAHRPVILLLDEASSHLDMATERVVEQQLNRLACTRIAIAHRLSTIRNADVIVVLEDGAIVAQGSHAELMRQQGYYAALVSHMPSEPEPRSRWATVPES